MRSPASRRPSTRGRSTGPCAHSWRGREGKAQAPQSQALAPQSHGPLSLAQGPALELWPVAFGRGLAQGDLVEGPIVIATCAEAQGIRVASLRL